MMTKVPALQNVQQSLHSELPEKYFREREISWDITHLHNLKNDAYEVIHKAEIDSQM